MDVRKKVLLVGIAIAVLSAAVATQYARVTIGYEYNIVHPSNGLIRFVALDNASDGHRLLRVRNNNTTATMNLSFGNIPQGMNKTYSAAFAIVNEEGFPINITGVTVSGNGKQYMKIWLHSNANTDATQEGNKLLIWDGATSHGYWILGNGNNNSTNMNGTSTSTPWDNDDNIRYAAGTPTATNGSTDFVWVQISIDANGVNRGNYQGTIEFNFKAE